MRRVACLIICFPLFTVAHADSLTRTKSWFEAHPDVSKRVNEICRNDPGSARHNANCINAEAALESDAVNRLTNSADREFAVTCASLSLKTRKNFGC